MVATILEGTRAINYADDIIIGGQCTKDLLQVADRVFKVLVDFGMKVNFRKTVWCSLKVKFLGF